MNITGSTEVRLATVVAHGAAEARGCLCRGRIFADKSLLQNCSEASISGQTEVAHAIRHPTNILAKILGVEHQVHDGTGPVASFRDSARPTHRLCR